MDTNTFFGATEKAYVVFRKYNSSDWDSKEKADLTASSMINATSTCTQLKGAMQGSQSIIAAANNINALAGDLVEGTGVSAVSVINSMFADEYVPFKVQYNPSSLRISSRGGDMRIKQSNVGGSGEDEIINTNRPSETFLYVKLIVDDTNTKDAFSADAYSFQPTVGGIASNIKAYSREHTVQTATEVFMAATTRSATSVIGFCWKGMLFWGEMTSLDITYTMFNKVGNPIRATIDFTLRQNQPVSTNESAVEEYATERIWEEAYQKLIKSQTLNKNAFGLVNSTNNIINI